MPPTKILLAEDNPDHQDLLVSSLTEGRPHVAVDVVDRGKRVIEILHTAHAGSYDCAILDFNLPDQNAAELLSHLKNRSPGHCPIVVVSSSNAQGIVIESMRNGSVDFVPKSDALKGDTLWRRVELAITQAQRRRETRRKIVRRSQRLAKLAERDPLTGLHNRRFLEQLFDRDRCVLDRRGQTSLCMIDLDRFKMFNDQFGHACGDEVLMAAAQCIRSTMKSDHIACRWGGEEILLILPGVDLAEAVATAELLRERIQSLGVVHAGRTLQMSASFGCFVCPGAELGKDTLAHAIDCADQAMYLAKQRGRNRVCIWEMVQFQQLVQQAGLPSEDLLETRLSKVVDCAQDLLGPTQLYHLTHHSQQVGEIAAGLADTMGLSPEERCRVRLAGQLHDLGKFIIPESILAKEGPLSPAERRLVDRHAGEGALMSLGLGADEGTAACVRHHHSPFDADNPPAAQTSPIPFGASILAASEAFVAMTSPCAYQRPRPVGAAVQELRRAQGGQFDPAVVDALVSSLRQDRFKSYEVSRATSPSRQLVMADAPDVGVEPLRY